MSTSHDANPVTLSADDICQRLRIDHRTFEGIHKRAPSPFGKGDGFQTQVLSNLRSPLDVEIEQLNLTPFPGPSSIDNAGPRWNTEDVDSWHAANQEKWLGGIQRR